MSEDIACTESTEGVGGSGDKSIVPVANVEEGGSENVNAPVSTAGVGSDKESAVAAQGIAPDIDDDGGVDLSGTTSGKPSSSTPNLNVNIEKTATVSSQQHSNVAISAKSKGNLKDDTLDDRNASVGDQKKPAITTDQSVDVAIADLSKGNLKDDDPSDTSESNLLSIMSGSGPKKKKRVQKRKRGPKHAVNQGDDPNTVTHPQGLTSLPSYTVRMIELKSEIKPIFGQWYEDFHGTTIYMKRDLRYMLPEKATFHLTQWGDQQYSGLTKKTFNRHGFQVLLHNSKAIKNASQGCPSMQQYKTFFNADGKTILPKHSKKVYGSTIEANFQKRFFTNICAHEHTLFLSIVIVRKVNKVIQQPELISSSLWTPLLQKDGTILEWFLHHAKTSNTCYEVDIMGEPLDKLLSPIPFRGQGFFKLHLRIANALSPCAIFASGIKRTSTYQCLLEHKFQFVDAATSKYQWTQETAVTVGVHGNSFNSRNLIDRVLFILPDAHTIDIVTRMDLKWLRDIAHQYDNYSQEASELLTSGEIAATTWKPQDYLENATDFRFNLGLYLEVIMDNLHFKTKGKNSIAHADQEHIRNKICTMISAFMCLIQAKVVKTNDTNEIHLLLHCPQCHKDGPSVKYESAINWFMVVMGYIEHHHSRSNEDMEDVCTGDITLHIRFKNDMHYLKNLYYTKQAEDLETVFDMAITLFHRFQFQIAEFIEDMNREVVGDNEKDSDDENLDEKQGSRLTHYRACTEKQKETDAAAKTKVIKRPPREPSDPGKNTRRYFLGENCDFFEKWRSIAYCKPYELKAKGEVNANKKQELCLWNKGISFSKPGLQVWIGYTEQKEESSWIDWLWMTDPEIKGISDEIVAKCKATPNTIYPLDTESLVNLKAIHNEQINSFIAEIKFIPRSSSGTKSTRSANDYKNDKGEWICYAPNEVQWLMESAGYMIGRNTYMVEERLSNDWLISNIDSFIIKQAKAYPRIWIEVPVGAGEKQNKRDKELEDDSNKTPSRMEIDNKCAPMSMAKMLFYSKERKIAKIIQQQATDWQSMEQVSQVMQKHGYELQPFDTDNWNIFKNKHKFYILLRLIDSYGDKQHCITIFGSEYADSNHPSILSLDRANLNITCGYKVGECDSRYIGFTHAIGLKKKET